MKPRDAAKKEIGDGPPCPRCLSTTKAWRHSDGWKPPAGRGYYAFWYQCMADSCPTHQIMPREAKVGRKRAAKGAAA